MTFRPVFASTSCSIPSRSTTRKSAMNLPRYAWGETGYFAVWPPKAPARLKRSEAQRKESREAPAARRGTTGAKRSGKEPPEAPTAPRGTTGRRRPPEPLSRGSQWTEHLHHEHGLAGAGLQPFERDAKLAPHDIQDFIIGAEHLRAHTVRDHPKATIGAQPLDKAVNHLGKLRLQRVEADFDTDVHIVPAMTRTRLQYCTLQFLGPHPWL